MKFKTLQFYWEMEFVDIYIAITYDEILIPYVLQWNLNIADYLYKMCILNLKLMYKMIF